MPPPQRAGLVDGGVDQGPWLQERVGKGWLGLGSKCFGSRASRASRTSRASRHGTNFATCFVFVVSDAQKEEKSRFLKDAVGWGGGTTGAGLVDGGVDQGPWWGWGLVGCFQGGVGWQAVPQEGARAWGGNPNASVLEG